MKLLKILTHISMVLLIIGITLLVSKGFVIKDFKGVYNGWLSESLEYTQLVFNERINVEGITFSSIGGVCLIGFEIIRRFIKC